MAKNEVENDSTGGKLNGHLSQRDSEVVRLIGQHLEDLGLQKVPPTKELCKKLALSFRSRDI